MIFFALFFFFFGLQFLYVAMRVFTALIGLGGSGNGGFKVLGLGQGFGVGVRPIVVLVLQCDSESSVSALKDESIFQPLIFFNFLIFGVGPHKELAKLDMPGD